MPNVKKSGPPWAIWTVCCGRDLYLYLIIYRIFARLLFNLREIQYQIPERNDVNTSEFAYKREDSGSGTTSADITINVSPLITKLHFIIIYFVTDPLTAYWQLSGFILESPTPLIIPRLNVSLEAFAAAEFNEIFSARQPRQTSFSDVSGNNSVPIFRVC